MEHASRLRDHVRERFDPRDTAWCFLRRAEEAVTSLGITLYLRDDFSRLEQVNRANHECWHPLMPMFDPQYYQGGQAFWIEGQNESGKTVCTHAERCYYLLEGSLADELMSLRLFYDDTTKSGATEACNCRAPSAFRLASRISYSGCTWAREEIRGNGLAKLLLRIGRTLAFVNWDIDYNIGLVEPVLVDKGIVKSYGYPNVEPGIEWVNSVSQGEDLKLLLVWIDRTEILRDLCNAMALAGTVQILRQTHRDQPNNPPGTRLRGGAGSQ